MGGPGAKAKALAKQSVNAVESMKAVEGCSPKLKEGLFHLPNLVRSQTKAVVSLLPDARALESREKTKTKMLLE